jgi:predicted glycoside hydrolase/deacetylase ChbG (UPF0249 family)
VDNPFKRESSLQPPAIVEPLRFGVDHREFDRYRTMENAGRSPAIPFAILPPPRDQTEMSVRSIVINADDFGLDPDIDDGIVAAIERGPVRSVSMVGNRPGLHAAVQKLKRLPRRISVGAHLNLTDSPPLSQAPPTGTFSGSHWSTVWALLGARNLSPIEAEFRRQIERLLGAGVTLEKLDSHGHIHVLPQVFDLTCRLASEYRIPFVRVIRRAGPMRFAMSSLKELAIERTSARSRRAANEFGLLTTDHVLGIADSGKMTIRTVHRALQHLPAGATEWIVHPGSSTAASRATFPWGYDWEGERDLLVSARLQEMLASAAIELVDFETLRLNGGLAQSR